MTDLLADFTASAVITISTTLGNNDAPDVIDLGAMRDLGQSGSMPVVCVELSAAEATATTKYQLAISHAASVGTAYAAGTVIQSSGFITKPNGGIILEMPLPTKHARFLRARLITSIANPAAAITAKVYIRNGNAGNYAPKVLPDAGA